MQVYVPMAQNLSDDIFLVVRPKSGNAAALAPSVRAAISRVDKEQLVSIRNILTLEDIAWTATGRHRFRAVLVVAFAALALVLAMVGVFGILAYSVQQHVRDFGVRRALGATTNDILRLVMVNAARVIASGPRSGSCCRPSSGGSSRKCCSVCARSIPRRLRWSRSSWESQQSSQSPGPPGAQCESTPPLPCETPSARRLDGTD